MTNIEQIKPQVGFLIVEPVQAPKEVAGIYQPGKDKEVPSWGKVITLGDVKADEAEFTIKLTEGQTVIFKRWGGNEIEVGGKKYYFLKYEEIIGGVNAQ